MKHTTEPWGVGDHRINAGCVYAETGIPVRIADVHPEAKEYSDEDLANALRIVTCVNACATMSDPEPEVRGMREALEKIATDPAAATLNQGVAERLQRIAQDALATNREPEDANP